MKNARVLAARAAVLLPLLLWLPTDGSAQSRTTSAIRGTVTETDGTPIQDVTISLVHQETGAERTVATNAQGRFLMPLLQPGGPYTLTVSRLGYGEQTREGIELQVGEALTINVTLTEEALELEGIDVEVERTEIFNPSQVGPATRLDEVTLEAMPILTRDFMDLAVLSPLVKKTEAGGFSVAGQNDRYNAILIDGVPNKDVFGLTAGGVPGGQAGAKMIPLDAVAQYEVLVSPFDVRLSGFTGGVMNAVTRTGTNEWRIRGFGVHRAEALMGDLNTPTGAVDASGVDRSLFGLSIGGPIVRDRGHFFVTGEFERRHQPPTGYNLIRDNPYLIRISPTGASEFRNLFLERYGLDVGEIGPYSLGQELSNIFARMDWDFGTGHRLTIRNVFAKASNDEQPSRTAFEQYELSSNGVYRSSMNNTTSLQLFSEFSDRVANELDVHLQRSTDHTTPASDWPQVGIDLLSSVEGRAFVREMRAGAQFFAHDNDLEQTNFRITNSLSLIGRSSTNTVGITGAYYDIKQRFLPGSKGDWLFADLDGVEANAPIQYQHTVLAEGEDPAIHFSVMEMGVFAQHQLDAGKGLTMRFGIRLDAPFVLSSPEENPLVKDYWGYSTSDLPSGQVLISPRWGFNYQTGDRLRTQVRGGAGVFAGQLPFVWLSNAFHNNGMRSWTERCWGRWNLDHVEGNTSYPFDAMTAPEGCMRGAPDVIRTVTLFDKEFKYPQVFRISAAVDQELSETISGTFGFLFNHSVNQVAIQDLNLGQAEGDQGPTEGYGGFERRHYGRATSYGFEPNPDHPEFAQVLLATNDGRNWAYSFTAEFRGRLMERLGFQAGYTWSGSYDKMSLIYNDMISNVGFTPISENPNNPELRRSNFDTPHKVVLAVFGTPFPGLENTEISLLYTGQSGLPFSYVYRGDVNGDGYPGLGGAFDRFNDLFFVPDSATMVPAPIPTWQLLSSALEKDDCLKDKKGTIMLRNSCRAPWQNRLDLRMSQTIHAGGANIRFEADIINVLNLINTKWGNIQTIQPVVGILEPVLRGPGATPGAAGPLISRWSGALLPSEVEEGKLEVVDPWAISSPASQWQIQFGARVTFDQGAEMR